MVYDVLYFLGGVAAYLGFIFMIVAWTWIVLKQFMFKYICLGFILGYAFSFVSAEWYYFVNSNFIDFCRWIELPDVAWAMLDKYIFFGAL